MGDFNIEHLNCSNKKWLHLVELFDLKQMVSSPTRVTNSSSSIIDHIYCTDSEKISECFVPHYSISDHFPVCLTRKINQKLKKSNHITTSYRCFNHFNEELFLNDLTEELSQFSLSESDIEDDLSTWYKLITKQLDQHAPIKTRRVKSKQMPEWFSSEIAQARKNRDIHKKQKNWAEFRKYRNLTKTLIRRAKSNHFTSNVVNNKDTKLIWQQIRAIQNSTQNSTKTLPEQLQIENTTITESHEIATKLNEFFATISKRIEQSENLSKPNEHSKLIDYINNKVPNDTLFKIPLITPSQVSMFIRKLNPRKATGLDGIGPKILKMACEIISPSIADLINKSIISGHFPKHLKTAKIYPIYKTGAKEDPSNYRPISILHTISKLFEKHVNSHLMGYLNKYNLIHPCQSGFRHKHSCNTALVKLIEKWMTSIDNGDIVGTLFIDFRKAFDMVDHTLLIKKLEYYKFSDVSLSWFKSYLSTRLQAIMSEQGLSEFAQILSGVPQGSILGPTLFLLFINDLPLSLNHCTADFYADDSTLHISDKNKTQIETKLQSDSDQVTNWSKNNKMPINYNKTTIMTLGSRHNICKSEKININIDNHQIDTVSSHKLLGVYIDETLSWNPHIDYLCSVITSRITLLKQLSFYVPENIQKLFYQSYILPFIDYGSNSWGSTSITNIERINKLQKRAARIILKADFTTPSADMFQRLGWMSVKHRIDYNKSVMTYKALHNLTPSYISDLLTPKAQINNRTLRSSEDGSLAQPKARTAFYTGSFTFSAPKLWNSLPKAVKLAPSLNAFKRAAKEVF